MEVRTGVRGGSGEHYVGIASTEAVQARQPAAQGLILETFSPRRKILVSTPVRI